MDNLRPPHLNLDFLKRGHSQNNNERDPCQEKWDNGLITYLEEPDAVSIRYNHNCSIQFDNQFFTINLDQMDKEAFLEEMPLVYGRPTEDGYYTWLIYSNEEHNKTFVASKTLSILEIGTIHKAIGHRVNAVKIHGAGELFVNNGAVKFNLVSGTYMLPALSSKRSRCGRDDLEDIIIRNVKLILGDGASYTTSTLIKAENLPVLPEEMAMYERHGAVIRMYNSIAECIAASRREGGRKKTQKRRKKSIKRSRH
jgi:hypothetical protein